MNINTGQIVQNIQQMVTGLQKGSVTADIENKSATFTIDDQRQVELIIEGKELIFITLRDEGGGDGYIPQHIISSHEMTGPNKKDAAWLTKLRDFTK
jgi:hypothetical protein